MRIALYHPWIYVKSGLERTILEIAKRSRHQWDIHTSHYDAEGTFPELREFRIRETDRVSVKRNYGAVLGASARVARTRLHLDGADALVVCCDGVGTFITLRNASVPVVNLCFTPLRAVYDPEYRKRHLARQGPRRVMALILEKGYRVIDRLLWRRYDRVVCISEAVRERVRDAGLRAGDDMVVFYPGVDGAAIAASERFEPFFFLPGRIMWTKNIELGIEAFLKFRAPPRAPNRLGNAG
jgi:glycosyltransferase involved in cell wall biosynthesis